MCYYVTQKVNPRAIAKHYKAQIDGPVMEDFEPFYLANGFAHPLLSVFVNNNGLYIEKMQWGLMNNWDKPYAEMLKSSNNTLNAKSETIFNVSSFKGNIMSNRCVLPVDSFFEYKHQGGEKLPYVIHPTNHPFFNLAAIFSQYQDPIERVWHTSFSICTTAANSLMAEIHNTKFRQPVIIDDAQITTWLNPSTSKEEVQHLMQPCDDTKMAAYRVDRNLLKLGNTAVVLKAVDELSRPTQGDLFAL